MYVSELKEYVMFQTNNDTDDLEDYLPYLLSYLNDGYDRLVYAWAKEHTSSEEDAEYPPLSEDSDEPNLPDWTHLAIADWATWLIYRNGNPQKQSRGLMYRQAFDDVLSKIYSMGGKNGKVQNFFNVPT